MDIPDSYSLGMINTRIVAKSVKDLQPYFSGLKVKIVKSNKRGNPVVGYEFTWQAEETEAYEHNKFNKPKFRKNSGVHDYQERKYDEEFYKRLLKGTKDQIDYDE